MTFRRYQAGDRAIDAADFNARAEAIESLLGSGGGRGLAGPDGLLLDRRSRPGETLWVARLTADAATPGHYAWTAQAWDADAGTSGSGGWWVDAGEGDSTLGPAIEINGLDAVGVGQIVLLREFANADGRPSLFFTAPRTWVWVRLTAAALLGANRWLYGGTRQARTATGFADFSPAMTIAAVAGDAFLNAIEAFNDGSGVEGHGVDVTTSTGGGSYPDGFSVRPVSRGGPVVRATRERLGDGTRVWTLQAANADDGACT
ncbi:MAG: hypothetical protein NTW19_02550 [Planctomycetota bacterium]|nr:hypothetical protein [Planctomycetota bacterium]